MIYFHANKKFSVIDYDPEVIESLEKNNVHYLYGDMTDLELLDEAGISEVKLVVSVVTDFETNKFLLRTLDIMNPNCTLICPADGITEAAELYEMGPGYVMLPHYIGSEKIGAFLKKNGFKKTEFRKFRDKHLAYLQTHFNETETETL